MEEVLTEVTFHLVPFLLAVGALAVGVPDTTADSELSGEWQDWADRGTQRLYAAATSALVLADQVLEPSLRLNRIKLKWIGLDWRVGLDQLGKRTEWKAHELGTWKVG